DLVAAYVARHPDRMVGFLSVDPTQPGWQDELIAGHQDLKMKGVKLLPMYAGFDPNSPELDYLWEYATKHGLPVLLHTGTTFIDKAPLEYTPCVAGHSRDPLPRCEDHHGSFEPSVRRGMRRRHSKT